MRRGSFWATRDIIVFGAFTGGVEALCTLLRGFPRDLPASLFVVIHVGGGSALGSVLDHCGTIPAVEAREGDKIERGRVYVAPSDRHLVLNNGQISLSRGPRENRHRPAVDPLFRSAARAYRERVIGVVLVHLTMGRPDFSRSKAVEESLLSKILLKRLNPACPKAPSAAWTWITACRLRRYRHY